MALRQIEYQGAVITAAAFEAARSGRFLVVLSIARGSVCGKESYAELYEPPSRDGMFDSMEEALESAVAFGRTVVDDDIAGEGLAES